ncbi:helix-turn-helix domain-containing protein [Paenibacillus melissococcoides]|uniref:Helix-turn-helix domain-containing protein n=1 Tax=Paenibacillus melissococcoides TaxID=2912268 RepID=A0ABM9G8U2_9BACL|nr:MULTISPECIES: helix-turn-helix transcriptional regulator [Paenibacillus]MEB9895939.1 helix-turn-helix transcriptional regulator [Bacillus cereus]CAH8248406.1 helix-turn-helix domain-containing protein [Paenibacillus melissococcoides]CAH8717584.1 helix-turn-helix domain-containing protein [Paenibacillus melissococcoides]CAH8719539.1 helix-turn-helix domain-containing protein [Paenibacillus melissococcoides]
MTLGKNIRNFRKNKGMTQFDLAEKTKLSRSYIADVERDRYNPSVDTLQLIASALDVKVYELLGEEVQETRQEEDWTPEELKEIEHFKEFLKSKRKEQ